MGRLVRSVRQGNCSACSPGVPKMVRFERRFLSWLIVVVVLSQFEALAWGGPLPPVEGSLDVAIQVEVYKDGQSVSGLTAEDFVVRDKGKEVLVVDLLEVDLAANTENLPEEAYRQLLLLFDLEFSDPLFVVQATDIAGQLITAELLANTRVLIVAHEPGFGLRIEVDFTDNNEPLLEMLKTLHDEHQRRLGSSGTAAGPIISGDDLLSSRARNTESDKGMVQLEQGRILELVRSLSHLLPRARSVMGSSQLVIFSPGFDSSVILGNDATQRFDAAWSGRQSEAAARGDVSAVESASRYGGGLVETALFEVLEDYRRSNVPIQGVKIDIKSASRPAERGAQGPNGLTIMADRTGGQVFRGTRDELYEITQSLEPAEAFYLLTFQSRSPKSSGAYRRLKVGLKGQSMDVQVVAPRGYLVP